MVKKASILERLKGRFRSGPVHIERGRGNASSSPSGRVNRVSEPEPAVPARPVAERVAGRKLSSKEEAVVALGEGFKELSSLVRGVQTRMEGQGDRLVAAAEQIDKLPAIGEAQLDLLRQLAKHLEQQSAVGTKMMQTFAGLPETLQGVRGALERAAATDERTAETLGEFRTTMDRIDSSMGKMVDQSRQHGEAMVREQKTAADRVASALERGQKIDTSGLEATVEGLRDAQEGSTRRLEQVSSDGLAALRRAQEDQATRLNKLVSESSTWQRAVVVLLTLTFLALAGILAVLAVS